MRVLHLTDTHLGAEMRTWGHPRGWTRAKDHADAFRQAVGPALREDVDLVVHSGDLFDRSNPPPDAIAAAAAVLTEVGRRVPMLIVRGNHDRKGIARHFPAPIPGVELFDVPARRVVRGLALALVPHRYDAAEWVHDARIAVGGGVDVVVAHQSFDGAAVPGFVFREGRHAETVGASGLPAGVDLVWCGHLHPRQVVHLGGRTIVHPGSTARTAFREGPAPKGTVLWQLGRRPEFRFVDLQDRPWVRMSGPADLDAVSPGALVGITLDVGPALAREVLDRGAWFVGRRPPLRLGREPDHGPLFGGSPGRPGRISSIRGTPP